MKITWVVPFLNKTGGIKVVFEYANQLQALGHDVIIVAPILPYQFEKRSLWMRCKIACVTAYRNWRGKVQWFPLTAKIKSVPWIRSAFLPDADVVIATAWPTAYSVSQLAPQKGMKYYFIQHYEVWSGEKSKVDGSYTLPLRHIVIATWLKDIMRKQFGREIHALIPNGVDFKAFYNPEKKWNQTPRLLLMYHSLPWKGFQDGIAVYHKVLQSIPNIKLTIFGMEPCGEIPKDAEYIQNPSPEKLRELYCHADIYLAPSWTEGWHLPPMEAMACKAAVVATNVGCIPDIGVHGQTAMVYEPHDIEGMAEGVVELLKNQAMLEQISVAGYELMQSYTWEKATQRLMLALQSDNRHA